MISEPVRPNRVDRPPPVAVWLQPQPGQKIERDHLRIIREPLQAQDTFTIVVRQGSQLISLVPDFIDEICARLRAARDWEDDRE